MKSTYVELHKEFQYGAIRLFVTFGATVHQNGPIEGYAAYTGSNVYLTDEFDQCDFYQLDEEFRRVAEDQYFSGDEQI